MDEYYNIEIITEETQPSWLDEIKSLSDKEKPKEKIIDDEPVMLMDITAKSDTPKKKSKNKKKKKSLLSGAFDTDEDYDVTDRNREIEEDDLLDLDNLILDIRSDDENENIIKEQKKGYKKLKKNENEYKKEFAEELTLLYSLLDETSKFGKDLEKELSSIKGTKTRGISKYTNDLAELVLTTKQNKLNILKEITSVKKTIADLKIKVDAKSKDKEGGGNNPEHLASAYFKNILNHGRGNFISSLSNSSVSDDDNDGDTYGSFIEKMEIARKQSEESEEDKFNQFMIDRLNSMENPYRSEAGTKYIEYENFGVKLYVKKCIDTGEWEFIAIDKNGRQIYDYPLPSKRDAGRMKFSDDGAYATDSKGRIYNVKEYYLPEGSF